MRGGELGEDSLRGEVDSEFLASGDVLNALGEVPLTPLDEPLPPPPAAACAVVVLPLPCCERGRSRVGEVEPGTGEAAALLDACKLEEDGSCFCFEDCCCCFKALKSQSCRANWSSDERGVGGGGMTDQHCGFGHLCHKNL